MKLQLLRQDAHRIFKAGIEAANPYLAVTGFFEHHPDFFIPYPLVHLIAFGKAACGMAKAAMERLPASQQGHRIAVTNYENVAPIPDLELIGAGHPIPDAAGFKAAQKISDYAKRAQANELVLILISGGGSALIPYPCEGISLAEKIATTQLLLACGATIHEINCVRKHLSQLKGGGLANYCAPAHCHALILSDVLDDDLSVIASGTTVADPSTFDEAIQVLQSKNVWQATPASVKAHLLTGKKGNVSETPKPGDTIFCNTSHSLVGSNALSVAAMHDIAKSMDYHTILYRNPLCGEAREVANTFVQDAQKILTNTNAKRLAFITGGETTVTLQGSGQGGRNQEMALAFAIAAEQYSLKEKWVFLSGGTDGIDGVSPAAGGIVDVHSITRMYNARVNAQERLNNNDSYHALKSADDLLITGATGTNVADLQILLVDMT